MLSCGVCFSDVKIARGHAVQRRLSLPHVPGHESAAVIATDPVGAVAGTRVVVYHYWPVRTLLPLRAGDEKLCRNLRARAGFTIPAASPSS